MNLVSCIGVFSVLFNDESDFWSPCSMFSKFNELLIIARHQSKKVEEGRP